jgi:V-type H+-transporting ATPase subunit a
MDLMIVCKWCTDFTNRESQAPSVISMMIGMALNGGAIESPQVAVVGSNGFQQGLSIFFLIVALICVPWMLIPKPFIIDKQNREHKLHMQHHEAGI